MNYYICDDITWKKSLSLLKNDMEGQRVYSSLWQMTRDVLMLSLSLSAMASLAILVFGLIRFIIDTLSGTTEQTMTLFDVIIFSMTCPATFVVPLTWVLAYFGWYKNLRKINSLLQKFIASLSETENVKRTGILYFPLPSKRVSCTIRRKGKFDNRGSSKRRSHTPIALSRYATTNYR